MKKIGVLFMSLVFLSVFMVAGCDNGSTSGEADPSLNGTWVSNSNLVTTFIDGNFEYSEYGTLCQKGTYTTNSDSMTIKVTHMHGDYITNSLVSESRWYTRTELKSLGAPDNELNQWFGTRTTKYSISGNTLILGERIYTKN